MGPVIEMAGSRGLMRSWNNLSAAIERLSLTRTVKLNVPETDVVPLMVPADELRVNPVGSDPVGIDHV